MRYDTQRLSSISGDGFYVTFASWATNLANGDANSVEDVFARDRDPSLAGANARPGSDKVGLEDFYPYRPFDVGSGTASVNMDTGNLVLQSTDISVPGQGLGLQMNRTYNATLDAQSGPLGPGWTLGVADGGDGVEGLLDAVGGAADGALDALGSLNPLSVLGLLQNGVQVIGTEQQFVGADLQFILRDADGTTHRFLKGGSSNPGWHSPPGVSLSITDHVDSTIGRRYFRATRPDGLRYEFRPLGLRYYLTEIRDRRGNTPHLRLRPSGRRDLPPARDHRCHRPHAHPHLVGLADLPGPLHGGRPDPRHHLRLHLGTSDLGDRGGRHVFGPHHDLFLRLLLRERRDHLHHRPAWKRHEGLRLLSEGHQDHRPRRQGLDVRPRRGHVHPAGGLDQPRRVPDRPRSQHRDLDDERLGQPRPPPRRRRRRQQREHASQRPPLRVGQQPDDQGDERGRCGHRDRLQRSQPGHRDPSQGSGRARHGYAQHLPGRCRLARRLGSDAGREAADTDEARTQAFSYFSDGSLKEKTDPEGGKTTQAYYVRGLLKTVTDPEGHTTTYGNTALSDGGYHASGEATRETDATGATEYTTYDFLGNATQHTDRVGKVWTSEYDLRGNGTKEIDSLGNDTWHCFDANDNEVLTVLPNQASPSCSLTESSAHVTRRTYDARDLPSAVFTKSDSQLRKTTYAYADDGELTETFLPRSFDASGNLLPASSQQKTVRTYYPTNRLKAEIDATGAQTDYLYTGDGQTRKVTEPDNGSGRATTTYTYTGQGEVATEQRSGHEQPTTYTYNLHGETLSETTPSGATTTNEYDKLGQVTKTTDPLGLASTRTYDANGNLVSLTQPTGAGEQLHTTYTYTPRGEIASESDPADAGHVVEYSYDPEGRQRFRYDRYNGTIERTIEQTFTDHGLLSGRTATGVGLPTHATTFTYDPNGNLTASSTTLGGSALSSVSATYTTADETKGFTETISGVAKTSSYTYLTDGSLASRTIDGQTTTYAYDLAGREMGTALWGGAGSFVTSRYPSGDSQTLGLPNGAVEEETYDAAGRLRSRVVSSGTGDVLSAWEKITYDGDDNRTAELVTQRPADPVALQRVGASAYAYDPASRLISAKHPFEATPVPYVLDDAANVLSDTESASAYEANRLTTRRPLPLGETSTYAYDHFGNITSETQGSATTTIGYDAASHTRRVTAPDGTWVEYAYDGWDRLVRRETNTGEVTLFFHDGESEQITLETDASGTVKTRYILDSAGSPIAQDVTGAPTRAYYVTDPRGNLTQLLDQAQSVVATFAYDAFGQDKPSLTETSSSWDARLRYQLAPRDPGTGDYTIGPRVYSPEINRFVGADFYVEANANHGLQLDPLTANRYVYAGANPVNLIDDGHRSCTRISSTGKYANGHNATMMEFARGIACAPRGFPYTPRARILRDRIYMTDPGTDGCSWAADYGRTFDFRIPCAVHDYLYDVLRWFRIKGVYGNGGRRRAADDAFYSIMLYSCSGRTTTRKACTDKAYKYYEKVVWVTGVERGRAPRGSP